MFEKNLQHLVGFDGWWFGKVWPSIAASIYLIGENEMHSLLELCLSASHDDGFACLAGWRAKQPAAQLLGHKTSHSVSQPASQVLLEFHLSRYFVLMAFHSFLPKKFLLVLLLPLLLLLLTKTKKTKAKTKKKCKENLFLIFFSSGVAFCCLRWFCYCCIL